MLTLPKENATCLTTLPVRQLGSFRVNGSLESYLLFNLISLSKNSYKNLRIALGYNISKLFETSGVLAFSVVGSTIYGSENSFFRSKFKPTRKSDIDCQVISDFFKMPDEIKPNFVLCQELIDLYDQSKVDILAVHGKIGKINIAIHFIKEKTYSRICTLEKCVLKVARFFETSSSNELSGYFHDNVMSQVAVKELSFGFIYEYNHNAFELNDFVPKLYHRMVLNSVMFFDKRGFLSKRAQMIERINAIRQKMAPERDALAIFRPRVFDWSSIYQDFMLCELGGGKVI